MSTSVSSKSWTRIKFRSRWLDPSNPYVEVYLYVLRNATRMQGNTDPLLSTKYTNKESAPFSSVLPCPSTTSRPPPFEFSIWNVCQIMRLLLVFLSLTGKGRLVCMKAQQTLADRKCWKLGGLVGVTLRSSVSKTFWLVCESNPIFI
jgi:hypothetical protein